MKCPVCKTECGEADKCSICGFDELNIEFLNRAEADQWYRCTLLPYKKQYQMSHIVKKSDWKTVPIGSNCIKIPTNILLPEKQKDWLIQGHKPRDMDDKWFVYYQDGQVFFHRSWTGICMIILKMSDDGNISEVTVDREMFFRRNHEEIIHDTLTLIESYSNRF